MGKAAIQNSMLPYYIKYGYISEGGNGGTASAGNNFNLTGFMGATGGGGGGKAHDKKGNVSGGTGGNGVQDNNAQKTYQNMVELDLAIGGKGGYGNSNGSNGNSPKFNSTAPYGQP